MAISTKEWVFTHPGAQEFGAGIAAEADAVLLGARPALAVRIRISSCSTLARPPSTVSISRRCAVVVSAHVFAERAEAGFCLGDCRERVQQVAGPAVSWRSSRLAAIAEFELDAAEDGSFSAADRLGVRVIGRNAMKQPGADRDPMINAEPSWS